MKLNTEQQERYNRHLILPEMGAHGQAKLLAARVLVVGLGGLGTPLATYLAAAGVGTLGLVDDDRVSLSNLGRQIAYETADIGRPKLDAVMDHLRDLNPEITLIPHPTRLSEENSDALLAGYDIVADGSDNFTTRFVVSAAAMRARIPLVSGALRGFDGQLAVFTPHADTTHPCYRCLVPDHPGQQQDCVERGILSPVAGVIGCMMAVEIIKILAHLGTSLHTQLLRYDALQARIAVSEITRDPACLHCGMGR